MTWNSGAGMASDDQGRAVSNGYLISGDDESGYRARAQVPLSAQETVYGCVELLFADTLMEIAILTRQQLILRSQVGAAATTR